MSTRTQLIGGLASFLGLALASAACAVGSAVDTDIAEGTLASTPIEAGPDDDGVKLPPPSTTEGDAGVTSDASVATKADAGDGGSNNNNNNNNNTSTCSATAPCGSAADLGTVSGDTGADVLTAQGTTSAWFRVMVNENDNGLAGVKLLASAKLDSPAGTNFDLFLYVGGSSAQECSAVSAQSTQVSGSDAASVSFGESGLVANGNKDSAFVTVEVRHVSGTCASNAKWTLSFKGNI